jgi:hypothetical protein
MVTSRIRFTAAQKAELWERWKNGQNAAAISRALERNTPFGWYQGRPTIRASQRIAAGQCLAEHLVPNEANRRTSEQKRVDGKRGG